MKYGLIGEKLGHSFSKVIHEKIAGYIYELKEIAADDLDSFMKSREFTAINVTIPYKTAVIPYLDEIDDFAAKIGAVNTVVNRDGRLYGYNTDFGGLRGLLCKNKLNLKDKKVLILGTGGTGKTAFAVCESLGAREIAFVSRKGEVNYNNAHLIHGDASFIINTTPCGMYPDNFSSPVDLSLFSQLEGVADVIYNPIKTSLSIQAEKLGIKSCNGLYMLVFQAVLAVGKFLVQELEAESIAERICNELLSEKRNIVLVGMPGSGKTTIGKALSEATGRPFVDTDEIIVKEHGEITKIFSEYGENYFRELESAAVKKASVQSGIIIATGGGAVLRQENVDALRQNGLVVFLNRPLEDIIPTADRPLSSDEKALKKRFEERYGIYVSVSDFEIKVDGKAENAVNGILEKLR